MKYQQKNNNFQEMNLNKVVQGVDSAVLNVFSRQRLSVAMLLSVVFVSGCSYLPENPLYGESGLIYDRSKSYQQVTSVPRLKIPEQLTVKQTRDIMHIPQVNLSSSKTIDAVKRPEYFYADSGSESVNLKRDGKGKVLLVDAPIQQIWPKAQQFMEFNNLGISNINPGSGIIDSDWIIIKGQELSVVDGWVKKLTFQDVKGANKNKIRIKLQQDLKDPQRTVISMAHVRYPVDQEISTIDWQTESKSVSYKDDMLYELLRFMSKASYSSENNGLLASTFKRSAKEGTVLFGRDANGKPALRISGDLDNTWRLVDNSLKANEIDVGTKDKAGHTFYLTFTSLTPGEADTGSGFFDWLHTDRGPLTLSSLGFGDDDEITQGDNIAYSAKGQGRSSKEIGLLDPDHPANQDGFKIWLGGKVIYNFNRGLNSSFFNKDTNLYELTAAYQLKLTNRGKATYITVLDKKGQEADLIPAEELLWRIKDSIPRA